MTECQKLKEVADQKSRHMLGHFTPTCEADGSFSATQCHGYIGFCWCATPDGTEVSGTRTRAQKKPDCTSLLHTVNLTIGPICQLPMKTGLCRAAKKRFYYNANTKTCKLFTYGGCGGNGNNFETMEECIGKCMRIIGKFIPTTAATIM